MLLMTTIAAAMHVARLPLCFVEYRVGQMSRSLPSWRLACMQHTQSVVCKPEPCSKTDSTCPPTQSLVLKSHAAEQGASVACCTGLAMHAAPICYMRSDYGAGRLCVNHA